MGEKHPMIEQIPRTQWPHCAWDQISQKSVEKQSEYASEWNSTSARVKSDETVNVEQNLNDTSDKKFLLKSKQSWATCQLRIL